MTLTIDLSKELEAALKAQALTHGVDATGYARQAIVFLAEAEQALL